MLGLPKYVFNVSTLIEFDDYEEYIKFRDKVDLAILRLGFRTHREFLRTLYMVLADSISDEEVKVAKQSIITNLMDLIKKRIIGARQWR